MRLWNCHRGLILGGALCAALSLLCQPVAAQNTILGQKYSYVLLASFTGPNGENPQAGLVMDSRGNLYGTTSIGGANNGGTVFEYSPSTGQLTTLASITDPDSYPLSRLVMDSQGNLYGTTSQGGAYDMGTVFGYSPSTGQLTTLVTFNGNNGYFPFCGLIMDSQGNLYGTTSTGGILPDGSGGCGTIFEYSPSTGQLTTLATFNNANGCNPFSDLVMDSHGNLYGTTQTGGLDSSGTVFEYSASTGQLTTLASFNYTNGAYPDTGLVIDSQGNLYGTTPEDEPINPAFGPGTLFEYSPSASQLTTLVAFDGLNGAGPGELIMDSQGNLYGVTGGGPDEAGTVFEYNPSTGQLTTLYSFVGPIGADGPNGALVMDSQGNFYGTTQNGGTNNTGTVFMLRRIDLTPGPGLGHNPGGPVGKAPVGGVARP